MPDFIDRPRRAALIQALKAYVARRISNDELDEVLLDGKSDDAGLNAVREAAWTLYSDGEQHFAEGKHALTLSAKKDVARWILFLRGESNYVYPTRSTSLMALGNIFAPLLSLLTLGMFGRWRHKRRREFSEAGDLSVWPFASRRQLRDALKIGDAA